MLIFKGMVEQAKLRLEQKKLDEQMTVLKRCGLEKEAKALLPKYNSIVVRIGELGEEVEQQRRESAHALLVCFVAADLASLAADQFADVCNKVGGINNVDNEFIRMMKYHAETSSQRWNEVVQILDEGAQNDNLSTFYADFSEEITDKVLPLINDSVHNVMENTDKGRKWL